MFRLVNSAVNMALPALLLGAVLRRRCCWAPAPPPLSVDISCPHSADTGHRTVT